MTRFFEINKKDSMNFKGKKIFRIVSKKSINRTYNSPLPERINIKAGESFGWIENKKNLPNDDSAILGIVLDDTTVSSSSYIDSASTVSGKSNINSSYISKSNIKNASLSSSMIMSSSIDGANDTGVVIDGPSRLIASSINGKVRIIGKCNISDACIGDSARVIGDVFIRKSASFDINSDSGFPTIGGNCVLDGHVGVYGPVKLLGNITVKDNAVLSGNIEIGGFGIISGDASVGLIDRLPDGTVKLISPNISKKEDFGVATEYYGETRSGVFCYRKNDKQRTVEFVSVVSGEEVFRNCDFNGFLNSSLMCFSNENNKAFDFIEAFNQNKIDKILNLYKSENPLNVYASIANKIISLAWFIENGEKDEFDNIYSELLNCCFLDIKTQKPCRLKDISIFLEKEKASY